MSSFMDSEAPVPSTRPAEDIERFFDRTLQDFREQAGQDRGARDNNRRGGSSQWAMMINEADRLRAHLASDPRVLYFEFNHDHEELSVKIADPAGHSHAYFVLSRHNPDTLEMSPLDCVWLRQIGKPDEIIDGPMEALRELAVRIARLLV